MPEYMTSQLDHTVEMHANSLPWRPPAGPRHRRPLTARNALLAALWTLLALVVAIVLVSVHRYGYGHALNGGLYWHTPFTPRAWSFGYEMYGAPGWFFGDVG